MAEEAASPPGPRSPTGRASMNGYLHRIEVRAIGLISRRRYWFALSESSHYLYWFKERDDVNSVGRLCLAGAALTYNPREKGRFEIHSGAEVHVLEATSDKARDEWMRALQECRKRSRHVNSTAPSLDDRKDIISLSSAVSSPHLHSESSDGSCGATVVPSTSQSTQDLIESLLGPQSSIDSDGTHPDDSDADTTIDESGDVEGRSHSESDFLSTTPSSTFYLNTDGNLNDKSMQMPKVVIGPEAMLHMLADKTNDALVERPMRALDKARKSLRGMRECEQCRARSSSVDDYEQRCRDLEDHVASLEDVVKVLKTGLLTAQKQVETMRRLESLAGDEDLREFLLEKEKQMTEVQMENNQLNRRLQVVETENRELDAKVSELNTSVEAFRDSVRTKEELIMRLCEESSSGQPAVNSQTIIGDVEVPEGILIDVDSVLCDEAAQMVFDTEGVRDVNEMKDLVEGYKAQNSFLNQEIVELHSIVQSLEMRERQLIRKNFDIEACYYQLKSRYLMVLNHFKSPEKPGKIMESGVLRELLEEANRAPTPRETQNGQTDTLGFYLKGKADERNTAGDRKSMDLLVSAGEYMEHANEIVEATRLEQSEGYMLWLQSWDGLLVNWVGRPLTSSNELKTLVRTGIPPAYRGRVWKSLVLFSVKDKMAELGNGYFECMLRKSRAKKEEGLYDSAIKQIDLDLARTLPTNKHFDDPDSGKIEQLRRVLYAFRYHNKDVGYCQGLNRLAAIALLYLEEEDAFWFMVACVEHLQPEGYYTSTLIGAVADQKVLRDLVAEKLPKLATHLRNLEVDLSLFALSWFLTCFVDILPHSVYLSIFDIFLYEGNKVLFRFALALLKQCESAVLQCRTIGTVHACLSRAADCVHDFRSLAQIAFNDLNPFPQKLIESKRHLYLSQLKDQG